MASSRALAWSWAAVLVFRLAAACQAPLTGDEAYYWLWSRHLAWGYAGSPMVAWVLALPGLAGLQHPFWLRLPFVLMGAAIPWIWNRVATALQLSPQVAERATWMLLFLPYLNVEATTATPNTPVLFFLSLAVCGTILDRRWSGLGFGLAVLSKFTALLWLPILLYFLVRRSPSRAAFWLATAVAVLLPYMFWNAAHDWEPFVFQFHNRHAIETRASGLLAFAWMQAAAASPLLLVGAARGAWRVAVERDPQPWRRGLVALGLVPLLVFGLAATREYVEIYWPLQAWLPLAVLAAWKGVPERRTGLWTAAILAPGLLLTVLVYGGSLWPEAWVRLASLGSRADFAGNDITELQAYQPLGQDLKQETGMVMTDHYGLSSAIWYYRGQFTWTLPLSLRGRELQRWQEDARAPGEDGLYVDRKPLIERADVADMLTASFQSVGPCVPVRYTLDGRTARVFWETRCRGFKGRFQRQRPLEDRSTRP